MKLRFETGRPVLITRRRNEPLEHCASQAGRCAVDLDPVRDWPSRKKLII
jgi:hypothetical protein